MDDDAHLRASIARTLGAWGYRVRTAPSSRAAIAELSENAFDLALVDANLSGSGDGRDVVRFALGLPRPPAALVMSGQGCAWIDDAIESGVHGFIPKPIALADLHERLQAALRTSEGRPAAAAEEPPVFGAAMERALFLADRVAATPSSPVLLVGESGVGKEVVAARIHARSSRRDRPFVCVNMAALPEGMVESELFGSVRGAFTDAKVDRPGHLASAEGGTLLLDELGELGAASQPKLLRVLEARRYYPLGSQRERVADVRIVSATNRDPDKMVERGDLRLDLFYRLGCIIRIPPLRERVDEILPLAEAFLRTFAAQFGRPPCALSSDAAAALLRYPWPGNVRQLRNVVERAVMLTDGDVVHADVLELPASTKPSQPLRAIPPPLPLHAARGRVADAVEEEQIARALVATRGSRARAARLLGISRSTLYNKLKRYKLT